ncbi:PHP domain-containing protein, partial [Streptomyces sp. NPDC059104]|uniref:PHP domain-containing protein n=1 Tax=Streptomyces sp. NPDC059104 TaxID=3346729 RepID=UPI0036871F55
MPGFTHLHTVSGFSTRYGASHPERLAERAVERGMDALALTDRDTLAGAVRFAKAAAKAGIRPLFGVDLAVSPAEPPTGSRAGAPAGGAGEASYRRRVPVKGGAFVDESAPRALFLARDGAAGWAQLCRMVTAAHAADPAGRPAGPGPDGTGSAPDGTGPGGTGFGPGGTGFGSGGTGFGPGGTGFGPAGPGFAPGGGRQPVVPWEALSGDGVFVLLGPGSEVGRALAAGRPDRAARLLAPWREVYGDA